MNDRVQQMIDLRPPPAPTWSYHAVLNAHSVNSVPDTPHHICIHEAETATTHALKSLKQRGVVTMDARIFRLARPFHEYAPPHRRVAKASSGPGPGPQRYPEIKLDDPMLQYYGGAEGELWETDGPGTRPRLVVP